FRHKFALNSIVSRTRTSNQNFTVFQNFYLIDYTGRAGTNIERFVNTSVRKKPDQPVLGKAVVLGKPSAHQNFTIGLNCDCFNFCVCSCSNIKSFIQGSYLGKQKGMEQQKEKKQRERFHYEFR